MIEGRIADLYLLQDLWEDLWVLLDNLPDLLELWTAGQLSKHLAGLGISLHWFILVALVIVVLVVVAFSMLVALLSGLVLCRLLVILGDSGQKVLDGSVWVIEGSLESLLNFVLFESHLHDFFHNLFVLLTHH